MEGRTVVIVSIKIICISYMLINAALADNGFQCGLVKCNRSGYDFCVRPPLVATEDDSFCLGCNTKQDLCGTSDQQSGCEPYCKEYLMSNWGCTNDSFVTTEDNRPRNHKKICLDPWMIVVFSVLFGCMLLLSGVLLWQRGGIYTLCIFHKHHKYKKPERIRPIPGAPPETEPLYNATLKDNVSIHVQDETTILKTTAADAGSSASETDTASNSSNAADISEEFKGPRNVPPTNHGDHHKNFAIG